MKFNKKYLYTLLITLVLAITAVGYHFNVYGRVEQKIHEHLSGKVGINDLYFNGNHVYLKKDLTQKTIDQAKKDADSLSDESKKKYLEEIDKVQHKFDVINDLGTLFLVNDKPVINGDQTGETLLVNPDLSDDEIRNRKGLYTFNYNDALNDEFKVRYKAAENVANLSTKFTQLIDKLPKNYQSGQLNDDLQHFQEVSNLIKDLTPIHRQQPKIKAEVDEVQEKAKIFSKDLIKHKGDLTDDLKKRIFNISVLADPLTGSEIDNRKLFVLTFDDGPSKNTLDILDILDKYHVKATFFQQGNHASEYPEISKEIIKRGHHIGNHTYDHPNMTKVSRNELTDQINRTQKVIEEATGGYKSTSFRCPYGAGMDRVGASFPDLTPVFWSIDSQDWKSLDPDTIVKKVLNEVDRQKHNIVLHHDTIEATTKAIDRYIPELQKRGYVFVFPEQLPDLRQITPH